MKNNKLTIVRGIPGSGKSTYAKNNIKALTFESDYASMENGEYNWTPEKRDGGMKLFRKMALEALTFGMDVAIIKPFPLVEEFQEIIDQAKAVGITNIEVIRLENDFGSLHDVPEHRMQWFRDNIEDYPGETIIKEK